MGSHYKLASNMVLDIFSFIFDIYSLDLIVRKGSIYFYFSINLKNVIDLGYFWQTWEF